jgi:choline kinase
LREDNSISAISKEVEEKESYGESIGIEVFLKEHAELLFKVLEKRIMKENRVNEFYEASFQEMIDNGLLFYALDIKEALATEIDDENDLNKARELFY